MHREEYIFLIALGPLLLVLLGAVAFFVQANLRSRARDRRMRLLETVLATLGWTLLLIGLFAGVTLASNVFFPFVWIAIAVVLLSARYQYRRMEQRSLLWILTIAAERGIPLEQAARDFAEERHDWLGNLAADLAEYLEAGLPLALAAQRSGLALPPAILLAADLGQQTGRLGPALRQAISRDDAAETVLRSAAEKLFYMMFLVAFGLFTWAFVAIKLLPGFSKIFSDFGLPLPAATKGLVDVSRLVIDYWPLLLAPVVLLLVVLFVRGVLFYSGLSLRGMPGLGRLERAAENAVVLRWLAAAVRRDRPIVEMLRLLAGYFPRRAMRRKLEWTAKRIDQGTSWIRALARMGLIRRPEVAVFQAAERTGNLAWALEEMAESRLRRAAYRLRAVLNVAFPAILLFLGGLVLLLALSLLSPIFALIRELA